MRFICTKRKEKKKLQVFLDKICFFKKKKILTGNICRLQKSEIHLPTQKIISYFAIHSLTNSLASFRKLIAENHPWPSPNSYLTSTDMWLSSSPSTASSTSGWELKSAWPAKGLPSI